MAYRYRLKSTGDSSAKYGLCEVCDKHVSEVFYQVEDMEYEEGFTRFGSKSFFGHRECLLAMRAEETQKETCRKS